MVAIATRVIGAATPPTAADERDLRRAGFLTFVDRPKADAGASIARLNRLGVEVKIITGDNGKVTEKLCRDLGVHVEAVMTGSELERIDDDALAAALPHTMVFSRVGPEQKAHIVKVARRGHVDVAFLSDGCQRRGRPAQV